METLQEKHRENGKRDKPQDAKRNPKKSLGALPADLRGT